MKAGLSSGESWQAISLLSSAYLTADKFGTFSVNFQFVQNKKEAIVVGGFHSSMVGLPMPHLCFFSLMQKNAGSHYLLRCLSNIVSSKMLFMRLGKSCDTEDKPVVICSTPGV